jgi:hypothetical protein
VIRIAVTEAAFSAVADRALAKGFAPSTTCGSAALIVQVLWRLPARLKDMVRVTKSGDVHAAVGAGPSSKRSPLSGGRPLRLIDGAVHDEEDETTD